MSWKDLADDGEQNDEPAMTLGDLRDGDEVTLTVREEPEAFTSDYSDPGEEDDAIRVPVVFHGSDYTFETEDGDAFEDGDEVTLISWSNRLVSALVAFEKDEGNLVSNRVTIQKFGRGYEVQYRVIPAGADEADEPAEADD
jgi:hypothetical protein